MANPAPEITQEETHAVRPDAIMATADGLADTVREIEKVNTANTPNPAAFKAFLADRLQRNGFDGKDIHRLATRDRHVFSALMLAHGHSDGMVTGATRKSACVPDLVNHVFDARGEDGAVGMTALLHRGHVVLIADTLVHEWPGTRGLAVVAACKVG